jgi:hypothetical protein
MASCPYLRHEVREVCFAGVAHEACAATLEEDGLREVVRVEQQAVAVTSDVTNLRAVVEVSHLCTDRETAASRKGSTSQQQQRWTAAPAGGSSQDIA